MDNYRKTFDQLLEYYHEISKESSEDDEDVSIYEARELEFNKRFPLLKELNVFENWKGLYIELFNFSPKEDERYIHWLIPTVFGCRNEDLTRQRYDFELFYFNKILEPDSS